MLPKILLAVALVSAHSVAAANAVTIVGIGQDSCANWTAEHKVPTRAAAEQENWVFGYLSGQAIALNVDTLAGASAAGIVAWVTSYCREHPQDQISIAALSLFFDLSVKPRKT